MLMKEFANKVAVITGAASGFGREFARAGARRRMRLVLADIDEKALHATAQDLTGQGAEIVAVKCDVRDAASMQALADAAISRFGAVHLLFNNAGVGAGGLIWENTEADWEWVLGVNLWGVIHGIRIFTPLMLACAKADSQYQGHIVNTASMAGLLNAPNMGAYNVSKHAVVSLSETLYHDLQLVAAPIGASVLCPFFVPTAIHQSERNRPPEVRNAAAPTASQRASQFLMAKAVNAGKVSAAEVAEKTFAAIAEGSFYIYSHPDTLTDVKTRMEDLLQPRNPTDPYAAAPQIKRILRTKLKG